MRVMRDRQDGVVQSYFHTAQHSSLAHAQQLWNEWEIQCLVMASFSLQVFLLSTAGIRKRYNSIVLSGLLWLAYLMADSVAMYVLGRLTLLVGDDPRHQLSLFWAPFLLLHLGGQETITAFSMEDNALWKRHLLNLTTQVAMAIYVVGKQWRGDKLLVAPMVLMFISGTVKYAERIWALRAASLRAPGNNSIGSLVFRASNQAGSDVTTRYRSLASISSDKQAKNIGRILEAASHDFSASLDFFMDVTPSKVTVFAETQHEIRSALMELQSSENRYGVAYKLAEMHVSLIYDYLYTKFGAVRFQVLGPIMGALQWLGALGLTSAALALFARAMANQKGRSANNYSGADVIISYILLVGAIILEISSIFIALISSYWAGPSIAKHLHRESGGEWSGKLAQYNMVDGWIQEAQTAGMLHQRVMRWIGINQDTTHFVAGVLQRAMRWIGIKRDTTHVVVSLEVKKLLLNKLLEIATNPRWLLWDCTKFQGQWALWAANGDHHQSEAQSPPFQEAAQEALITSRIQEMGFVSSAIVWHFVTHICVLADGPEVASPSKELSNYIMYLVAKHNVMVDSDGHIVMNGSRTEVLESGFLGQLHEEGYIQKLREYDRRNKLLRYSFISDRNDGTYFVKFGESASIALRVCVKLLKIQEAKDRWQLIAAVWMEMLCYMALNCGAGFHAKHLTTGGEFITQVKMLLFIIGLHFLRSTPTPKEYESDSLPL